jgi:hypothetical protein
MKIGFFSSFEISLEFLRAQLGEEYCQQNEVLINPSGVIDIAFTFNYSKKFLAYLHRGPEYFLVMEPQVPGIWHTFVSRKSRKYRTVFSPQNGLWSALPWHVGFNLAQLQELSPPPKTRILSTIASTAGALPGHLRRLEYIRDLQKFGANFDLFGRGREVELVEKSDGLLPYMYSVAIENSNQAGYFTEKIFDPILCWTVPVYVGAPDIEDYLPSAAYVSLPPDDPERGAAMLSELSEESYKSRLPALAEARALILEKYSMGAVIRGLTAEHESGRLRFKSTFGFNFFIHRVRDLAARIRGVWPC